MAKLNHVSIVMCTYNRAHIMEESVDSFFAMNIPNDFEFELIIVNNNSTDHTLKIAIDLQNKYGSNLKYIFESTPGLSHARNRGLAASTGEIVAFVDDDIFFEREWLKNLLSAFSRFPEVDSVGGKIEVVFEGNLPRWLNDERLEHYSFGATKFGDDARILKFPHYPYGSNMAFRRSAIFAMKGFSTNLGRTPATLLSNEETEFFYRFGKANFKTLYVPNALIRHRIPQFRLTRKWVLTRFYWQGISNAVMKNNLDPQSRMDLLKLLRCHLRMILQEIFGKTIHPVHFARHILDFKFERIVVVAQQIGFLKQTIKFIFSRNKQPV